MMTKLVGFALGVALAVAAVPAFGYNWHTHREMPVVALDIAKNRPFVTKPGDVRQEDWDQFIGRIYGTMDLWLLQTGLPTSLPNEEDGSESYPFYECATCLPGACAGNLHPEVNLDFISQIRIKEFGYYPNRSANPCGVQLVSRDDPNVLGKVLGWHGAGIDDHLDDSVLWYRPTNMGGLGGYAQNAVSQGHTMTAGALLLPFVCAYDAIFGDGCDASRAFDLAEEYNPVEYAEGWIPGFGSHRSGDYTGLWHFVDMDAQSSRYNDIRGMLYEEAGPDESPGVMDLAILAGADLSGLSLNAGESDGDDFYGDLDRVPRGDVAWQTHSLGHVEFSPLDNLALYGWNEFVSDGFKSARGLGWPLHAIGDAAAPHHVVGTTSWGHRPYEDYISQHWDEVIVAGNAAQRARIFFSAFYWWNSLRQHRDIRRFITDLAAFTRSRVRAQGDWAYDDYASFHYHTAAGGHGFSVSLYKEHHARMVPLVEEGIAATLAFLMFAAEQVQDPGPVEECPYYTRYSEARGCIDDPSRIPPIDEDAGTGGDSGQCLPGVQACGGPGEECPTGQFCDRGCCTNVPH